MKISYLITCKNETDSLQKLLDFLIPYLNDDSEYENVEHFDINDNIVILDDYSDNEKTIEILKSLKNHPQIKIHQHELNNNYGEHKNTGIYLCDDADFIFQIDADELPSEEIVGKKLHIIIKNNPKIEAFAVPRINDFKGVTNEHAKKWGWVLSESLTYKRYKVNWPDYQFRIFRRDPSRIHYKRRLHEKIEGYQNDKFVCFYASEEYALYHDKTIEKQVETNLRYNRDFTEKENRGHSVFNQDCNVYKITQFTISWDIEKDGILPKEGQEIRYWAPPELGRQNVPMLGITHNSSSLDIPKNTNLIPKYGIVKKITKDFKTGNYKLICLPSGEE